MNGDEATAKFIQGLNETNIPYMLVGSYASNFYGIPRLTQDADFCADLTGLSLGPLKTFLGPDFRFEPQLSFESATGTTRHIVHVTTTEFTIELFRLSSDAHDQQRFRRRQRVKFADGVTFVLTVEDVVITKLRWFLQIQRHKDRDDVSTVISVSGKLMDWDYIHYWCELHGTRALLDEIRASLPPI